MTSSIPEVQLTANKAELVTPIASNTVASTADSVISVANDAVKANRKLIVKGEGPEEAAKKESHFRTLPWRQFYRTLSS